MKVSKPLIVYLDSSDYSCLSKRSLTADYRQCLESLKILSKTRQVIFVFSSSIVAEMLPVHLTDIDHSTLRLRLMNELCARSVIDMHTLINKEMFNLANMNVRRENICIPKHDWGANFLGKKKPIIKVRLPNDIDKKRYNEAVKELSKNNNFSENLSSIVLSFGLKAISEDVAVNGVSFECRDIDVLLRLIKYNFELSNMITGRIRVPSSNYSEKMKNLTKQPLEPGNNDWITRSENLLLHIVNDISKEIYGAGVNPITVDSIKKFCPGITTSILSGYSTVKDSFKERNPRVTKSSDLVDSFHALYAPYVDFFRADRYMSSHIQQFSQGYPMTVVNNLLELPERIKQRILRS